MGGALISVKEARKLLGERARQLTDEQVESIITQLDFIATLAVQDFRRKKSHKEGEVDDK